MTITPPRSPQKGPGGRNISEPKDLVITIGGRRRRLKGRVLIGLVIAVLILLGILWQFIWKTPGSSGLGVPKIGVPKMFQKKPALKVERKLAGHDQDNDGIDDLDDIVKGARAEARRRPRYKNAYYKGGYPPATEGVCTDVIWRAFKDAGYNLKEMVDKDIKSNLRAYPRVQGKPDPHIDFRRVPNLTVFFKRHGTTLTTKIIPGNKENLAQWQGGDIVVFGSPYQHIGIVSDKRRDDGVPLLLHNGGPWATENDMLLDWPSPLVGHYRFPKSN